MGFEILGFFSTIMAVILAWIFFWKGWALWIAARKGSKPWFIALLIINTMGILEILYIFVFSRLKEKKSVKEEEKIHDTVAEEPEK